MENRTQASLVLMGAALGAGFTYLFFTKQGQRLLDSAEPWLNDVIRDIQRLQSAAAKAKDAVDEGRRSLAAVQLLAPFGRKDGGVAPDPSH